MSRDQDAYSSEAQEAGRQLRSGIESSQELVEQYRARLLALKTSDELSRGQPLLANGDPSVRG